MIVCDPDDEDDGDEDAEDDDDGDDGDAAAAAFVILMTRLMVMRMLRMMMMVMMMMMMMMMMMVMMVLLLLLVVLMLMMMEKMMTISMTMMMSMMIVSTISFGKFRRVGIPHKGEVNRIPILWLNLWSCKTFSRFRMILEGLLVLVFRSCSTKKQHPEQKGPMPINAPKKSVLKGHQKKYSRKSINSPEKKNWLKPVHEQCVQLYLHGYLVFLREVLQLSSRPSSHVQLGFGKEKERKMESVLFFLICFTVYR